MTKARETLRTGYSRYDEWAVDHERDMVLFRRGCEHSMEAKDEDFWSFITANGEYCCDTDMVARSETRPGIVAVTRRISFQMGIREALQENSRRHLFNLAHYQRCQLTLIDVRPGEEI